jgi:hypothetical protein
LEEYRLVGGKHKESILLWLLEFVILVNGVVVIVFGEGASGRRVGCRVF